MKNIILADCAKNEITSFADGLSKETNKNWEIVSSVSNWGQASKIQNLKRYAIYFAAPFKAFCKRKQYASIVGWQQFYALIFCFYCRLFKVKKTNRVVALNFTYKAKKGFIGKIYKRFMQYMVNSDYIDYIHVLSHNYAKKCVEELGIDEKKILVFPFGTNDQYESFKKIKKTENEFVLAIGRSNRDYEWLIDEWRNVDYPLYIICDTFKAPNNLPNNIKIFNNITGNAQYKFIASCKYLVLPIKDESICSGDTVLLTAMSNKKTVIVNGPSTLTEMYVKDGENAIVVSKNKGDLAEKMNYLIKNNIEIGESARKSYLENYSRKAMGINLGNTLKTNNTLTTSVEQEDKLAITVLTPTYNRSDTLSILYNSLCRQTVKDFCWLIVDDGSTDNTDETVNEFIKKADFRIDYVKKENGGKHTALNTGIQRISTPLTFIVDSDDYLTDNAIENIYKEHSKFKNDESICGYSFLRQFTDGKINGLANSENEIISNYINFRINKKDMNADKAEVWKTKILKEFPFPVFDGERFLGEDSVWIPMSLKYNMVFLNTPIYVSEYLPDGLTKNRRKNNIKCPMGCRYRALVALNANQEIKITFEYYIKVLLQYHVFGFFAKIPQKKQISDNPNKIMHFLTLPFGYIIYLIWKNDIKYK